MTKGKRLRRYFISAMLPFQKRQQKREVWKYPCVAALSHPGWFLQRGKRNFQYKYTKWKSSITAKINTFTKMHRILNINPDITENQKSTKQSTILFVYWAERFWAILGFISFCKYIVLFSFAKPQKTQVFFQKVKSCSSPALVISNNYLHINSRILPLKCAARMFTSASYLMS